MFTPMAGPAAGLAFVETLLSCVIGGILSVSIFYFGSSYFMEQTRLRRIKRVNKAVEQGKEPKFKKRFTQTNRSIIHIKNNMGQWLICWLVPLFLSLPLGTVIAAKFYKHNKYTFHLVVLGVIINCSLITGGTYLVHSLISLS